MKNVCTRKMFQVQRYLSFFRYERDCQICQIVFPSQEIAIGSVVDNSCLGEELFVVHPSYLSNCTQTSKKGWSAPLPSQGCAGWRESTVFDFLDFDYLECSRVKDLDGLPQNIFTMVKTILDFDDLKCSIVKDLDGFSQNISTMVDENFRFW